MCSFLVSSRPRGDIMADLGPAFVAASFNEITEAGINTLTAFLVSYIMFSSQTAFTPAFNAGLD